MTYPNPSPEKLVTKIEVWLKQEYNHTSYEALERNTVVYGANPAQQYYLTLDLPQYSEQNATHFRVKVETDREGDDDVWFELVDENGATKTYANADFGKLLPIEAPIVNPAKLRIYLKPKTSSPTLGGTALSTIYWGTNDPKSLWTGTERVLRDNHYAEGLQDLNKRNFSDPKTRYSTVGFRLVQRP